MRKNIQSNWVKDAKIEEDLLQSGHKTTGKR